MLLNFYLTLLGLSLMLFCRCFIIVAVGVVVAVV